MSAYVPALRATGGVVLRRVRRLPIRGQVLVRPGQEVGPEDLLARAEMPGSVELIAAAGLLGVEPGALPPLVCRRPGETVAAGDLLVTARGPFGRGRKEVRAPCDGVVEHVSAVTGQVVLRRPPVAVELPAHLGGTVVEVLPGEGAVVEASGALVQGVFGLGGERRGRLVAGGEPSAGAIWVLPGPAELSDLQRAAAAGVCGLVAAGARDVDLESFLGHDAYAAALTGGEAVPFSLLLTEGFGRLAMGERAASLLRQLAGRRAALSGATQLRAGVVRPEVFVPHRRPLAAGVGTEAPAVLAVGALVRLIREPRFGTLGRVVELPVAPQPIATGARVRVARVRLADGQVIDAPRANVEWVGG